MQKINANDADSEQPAFLLWSSNAIIPQAAKNVIVPIVEE
jgi:hypothetical protein